MPRVQRFPSKSELFAGANCSFDEPKYKEDDSVEQCEHPVFHSLCPATEDGIFLEDLDVPFHFSFLLMEVFYVLYQYCTFFISGFDQGQWLEMPWTF